MDVPAQYAALVQWIRDNTDMSDAVLHIHAGMAILLIVRMLTRFPLSHPVPFATVAILAVANEILNRMKWGSWRPDDTVIDVYYTVFWPAVLFVALWYKKRSAMREASAGMAPDPQLSSVPR